MKSLVIVAATACAMAAYLLPQAAHAQMLEILNPPLQVQAKKKSVKQKTGGNKTKFLPGSQETTKERSARLQRECKGAVNAGACAGYAR